MKKYIYTLMIFGVFIIPSSCDFLDPTEEVINPNLTVSAILGTVNPMAGWLIGQEREMAILYNSLTPVEIGSDNYVNTETFFNQQFDGLNITFQDININTILFGISDLRESAIIG